MVNIGKGPAPAFLAQYKREAISRYGQKLRENHIFDDFPQKTALRTELAKIQGYLCAYCMSRITDQPLQVKIDHCRSQEEFPEEKLDFENLLLCCKGNEGEKPENQHCDTRKRGKSFSFNPSINGFDMSRLIKYKHDGTIYSDNIGLNNQLNDMLNLNTPRLKSNRESIIKAVEQALGKRPGMRTPGEINRLMNKWKGKNAFGQHKRFYGVALYKLNRHSRLKKK